MPIFIAKTHDGKVQSVVLARSRELAVAYWHGQDTQPFSITERTDNDLIIHPTGVLPILNTKEKEIYLNGKFNKFMVVV